MKKKLPFNILLKKRFMGFLMACIMVISSMVLAGCNVEREQSENNRTNGTIWYSGTEYSDSQGVVGDFFFDTNDFDIYTKTAEGWTWIANIKGQQGEDGPQGPQGEQGPTGENGQDGQNGITPTIYVNDEGFWVINGVTTNTKAEGTNGIDGITPTISINDEGFWVINGEPTNVKAKGEDGVDGKDGTSWITGDSVPTDTTGQDGDTYLDITTNFVYTKNNGVWSKLGELSSDSGNNAQQSSAWVGKTAVFVGDSITFGAGCDGDRYWEILEEELGFSQVIGMGVSGSCISAKSDYGTNKEPLINRYNAIPQADLIQIFMGTNDYGHGTPLGTINDTTDVSFYGALNVILPALQQKYPTSRIVVCTPLHRYNANTTTQTLTYDYLPHPVTNLTLEDYVNALKDVCQRYSIPVIDLFNISGINPTVEAIKNTYMPDGIHPNANGHKIIANLMKQYLNLFATGEDKIIISTNYQLELVVGNKFSTDSIIQTNTNRVTASKNIYLNKDTIVNVKELGVYNMAVYSQTGEQIMPTSNISGGFTDSFTISESGYYGFVLSKDDGSEFNFSTESKEFYDYVTLTKMQQLNFNDVEVELGSKYGAGYETNNARASSNKNVYLESGTVVSLSVNDYAMGIYLQNGETTITTGKTLTNGWATEPFTITESGYYGFAFKRTDDNEFDFLNVDPTDLSGFVTFTIEIVL